MTKKITLDMLTQDGVSVKTQEYNQNGEIIGYTHRITYRNSPNQRKIVQTELETPYQTAIFAIWGDTPTVSDVSQ